MSAWDGYQANRNRLLSHIHDNSIDNVVAFTGDTHANWLFENSLETTLQGSNDTATLRSITTTTNSYQRGTVVEYGGTAVSSSGWGNSWGSYENSTVGARRMVENNPTLLYSDAFRESFSPTATDD
jgi:alkaline phosphatase D